TTYSMSSSNQKNWSLCGNHLSAGNRTITITAYASNGQTVTKTLNVNVTEIAYPSKDITVNYKYYKDVPSNHWAHKYVCAASYYGLMQGVGNDEFDPDSPIKYAHFISVLNKIHYVGSINNYDSITRTDAVVWLWQAAGCPSAPMNLLDNKTDANLLIDTDSKYAWSWCMQNNIVNGYEDGTLRPNNTISRAEAAAIFVRYYCLEKEGFRVNNIYVV
ncbi:MAG: S-layer homology domain-containing protein, partial [Acutalibacteraceae bacterium]